MFVACIRDYNYEDVYRSKEKTMHTIEGVYRPNASGRVARSLGFSTAPIPVFNTKRLIPDFPVYVVLKDSINQKEGYVEEIKREDVLAFIKKERIDEHNFILKSDSKSVMSNNIEGVTEDLLNALL